MTKIAKFSKILIVDDEVDMLDSYEEIFERSNYEVYTAENGKKSLDIYRDEFLLKKSNVEEGIADPPFEVVILDYMMPEMNGLQVAEKILSVNPHQRIIFASAYLEGSVLEAAKQLGRIIEVIKKPFPLEELIDLVENKKMFLELEKLNVNIENLKQINPNQESMKIYLEALTRLERGIIN